KSCWTLFCRFPKNRFSPQRHKEHKGRRETSLLFSGIYCQPFGFVVKKTFMPFNPIPPEVEGLAKHSFNCALKVHRALGPGLRESVYEVCLKYELEKLGLRIENQVELPVVYEGIILEAGMRLDLWLERKLIIEVKAVERVLPVHQAQLMTYLKLTGNRLGLLMNFNVTLIKDGIKRVAL
ncbi:MAG TPA: GxxExxY protein, partial [Pyrinomonadaceae bacterium]